MSMNQTPAADRVHIGFFGMRNAGKSSVVNAITGQALSIVSDIKGTTTDPVMKSMELLPLGPVVIVDTPGIDDEGELGEQRVKRARRVLNRVDVAVLVVDAIPGRGSADDELISLFREKDIPYIVAVNKADLVDSSPIAAPDEMYVSALTGFNIDALRERIATLHHIDEEKLMLVGDIVHPYDFVVLVTPIDKAAPKGRLILPQQKTIRDILEADATAIVVKEFELRDTLASLGKRPALVITDSQAFAKVAAEVPLDIPLTSFSILFARYKGLLEAAVAGAAAIDSLKDGDTVLISEGCTHHRQCDDIGTVKIPRWLRSYTGSDIVIKTTSGAEFDDDLSGISLVIHCGGCMLTEREVKYRMRTALSQNVPITNYGVAIAHMQGILKRSISIFPHLWSLLEK